MSYSLPLPPPRIRHLVAGVLHRTDAPLFPTTSTSPGHFDLYPAHDEQCRRIRLEHLYLCHAAVSVFLVYVFEVRCRSGSWCQDSGGTRVGGVGDEIGDGGGESSSVSSAAVGLGRTYHRITIKVQHNIKVEVKRRRSVIKAGCHPFHLLQPTCDGGIDIYHHTLLPPTHIPTIHSLVHCQHCPPNPSILYPPTADTLASSHSTLIPPPSPIPPTLLDSTRRVSHMIGYPPSSFITIFCLPPRRGRGDKDGKNDENGMEGMTTTMTRTRMTTTLTSTLTAKATILGEQEEEGTRAAMTTRVTGKYKGTNGSSQDGPNRPHPVLQPTRHDNGIGIHHVAIYLSYLLSSLGSPATTYSSLTTLKGSDFAKITSSSAGGSPSAADTVRDAVMALHVPIMGSTSVAILPQPSPSRTPSLRQRRHRCQSPYTRLLCRTPLVVVASSQAPKSKASCACLPLLHGPYGSLLLPPWLVSFYFCISRSYTFFRHLINPLVRELSFSRIY
ncbi:hypothetical protein EW146_g9305 [Bondarzewia mesenterica]|uniref:Uncharacterized protein n=1 Tax=Bondarzewia mesenterica TaxID=1095465 RepID=A0A4S4L8Y4_9AGAM|nr:hypothetical protein EW146_g9305 [Bondarzewia mesenterica]